MKKYDSFCAALENLKDIYNYEEPYENVVLTGLVALYEICFEQAWKAMKELLDNNGAPKAMNESPKMILKTAYQMGMIQQEDLWLEALQSRNNVTHAYNKLIALDIVHSAKALYYNMFVELKNEIEENWL